jgi:predicted TIM-barrel fold metal-dependent hydrolase
MAQAKKMFLASADGHVGSMTAKYRDYIDPQYRENFDEYLKTHLWMWSPAKPTSMLPFALHDRMRRHDSFHEGVGSSIVWDPALRLREYDRDGIVLEVLVPDDQNLNDPPWGSGLATSAVAKSKGETYGPEWQRRGALAYNRWLAEFCAADPKRLRGLTLLGTLEDVDWAIAELRRAHKTGLQTGVLLPLDYYLPLYHHPRYDAFWAVCQELDLTIAIHLSKGGPDWVADDLNTLATIWFKEATWYAQRPLWCLIFGGVFDRFPKLRVVFTEIGIDWVNPLLTELDLLHENKGPLFTPFKDQYQLSMRPSEYFQRNCYVTHSAVNFVLREDLEGARFKSIPNMIWGADIGHGEGFWPSSLDVLRPLVNGLPESTMRPFLGEALHKAYPSTTGDYSQLVARIAPTAGDLGLVA